MAPCCPLSRVSRNSLALKKPTPLRRGRCCLLRSQHVMALHDLLSHRKPHALGKKHRLLSTESETAWRDVAHDITTSFHCSIAFTTSWSCDCRWWYPKCSFLSSWSILIEKSAQISSKCCLSVYPGLCWRLYRQSQCAPLLPAVTCCCAPSSPGRVQPVQAWPPCQVMSLTWY